MQIKVVKDEKMKKMKTFKMVTNTMHGLIISQYKNIEMIKQLLKFAIIG
jgi:hypothetical protein